MSFREKTQSCTLKTEQCDNKLSKATEGVTINGHKQQMWNFFK